MNTGAGALNQGNMGFNRESLVSPTMLRVTDVHSVTDFQRNTRSLIEKAKETGAPLVLTVNGRAEVVVQDARVYQALLDRLREMEDQAAVREGLADADAGRTRPAEEAFSEFMREHGIPG